MGTLYYLLHSIPSTAAHMSGIYYNNNYYSKGEVQLHASQSYCACAGLYMLCTVCKEPVQTKKNICGLIYVMYLLCISKYTNVLAQ